MEQALRREGSIVEEVEQSSSDNGEVFDAREQVFERFADTPMAYTVNGTTYRASGSHEAILLCNFLQNEKLPAAFFEAKFQEAAMLSNELIDEELKSAEEAIKALDTAHEQDVDDADTSSESDDLRMESQDSPADIRQREVSSQSASTPSPDVIERLIAEHGPDKSDSKVDKAEASTTPPENEAPVHLLDDESEVVISTIQPVQVESVPIPHVAPTMIEPQQFELPRHEPQSTSEDIAIENEIVSETPLSVVVPGEIAPIDSQAVNPADAIEISEKDDELQVSTSLDAPALVEQHSEHAVVQEEPPLEPEHPEIRVELIDDSSEDILAVSEYKYHEVQIDLEPQQQTSLDELAELLAELSFQDEAESSDAPKYDMEPEESRRIEKLYKCLDAQVQQLAQVEKDGQNIDEALEAVYATISEVAKEAGIDDTEFLARLYVEVYGVSGLYDIVQTPTHLKTQHSSRLISQSHKVASFATRLIVYCERIVAQESSLLARSA